jgi:hypothetical protein
MTLRSIGRSQNLRVRPRAICRTRASGRTCRQILSRILTGRLGNSVNSVNFQVSQIRGFAAASMRDSVEELTGQTHRDVKFAVGASSHNIVGTLDSAIHYLLS